MLETILFLFDLFIIFLHYCAVQNIRQARETGKGHDRQASQTGKGDEPDWPYGDIIVQRLHFGPFLENHEALKQNLVLL